MKKLLLRLIATISNDPKWKLKYAEYTLKLTKERINRISTLQAELPQVSQNSIDCKMPNEDKLDASLEQKELADNLMRVMFEGLGLPTALLGKMENNPCSVVAKHDYQNNCSLGKMQNNSEEMQSLGKMQNNSGNTQALGYAETVGKMQNNSGNLSNKDYAILNLLHKQQGLKPCLDRTIIAVIEHGDKIYIGTNGIRVKPQKCHRAKEKINQGYEKCKQRCEQPYHAEEAAIVAWLADWGDYVDDPHFGGTINEHPATISIYGAKALCERCKALCEYYKLPVKVLSTDLMGFLYHGTND